MQTRRLRWLSLCTASRSPWWRRRLCPRADPSRRVLRCATGPESGLATHARLASLAFTVRCPVGSDVPHPASRATRTAAAAMAKAWFFDRVPPCGWVPRVLAENHGRPSLHKPTRGHGTRSPSEACGGGRVRTRTLGGSPLHGLGFACWGPSADAVAAVGSPLSVQELLHEQTAAHTEAEAGSGWGAYGQHLVEAGLTPATASTATPAGFLTSPESPRGPATESTMAARRHDCGWRPGVLGLPARCSCLPRGQAAAGSPRNLERNVAGSLATTGSGTRTGVDRRVSVILLLGLRH